MAGTRRVTLREASEILGVSVEAVRKRVKRGSLRSDKGPDGRVYVYLDAGGAASHPGPGVEGPGDLVEELRDRISYLERQLDVRTGELKEHRRLLAGLIERVPELEAPQESPGAPEPAEEEQQGRSGAPGAQEGVQRPWWRRVLGR
jgi:hypothetical protein